jgi:uncharacterized integral membrane protein
MRDLTPTLILSLVMGVIVYVTVSLLNLPNIILLLLGVVEGALIYIVGAKLFRFSEFEEALELLHRNKNNDQHVEY